MPTARRSGLVCGRRPRGGLTGLLLSFAALTLAGCVGKLEGSEDDYRVEAGIGGENPADACATEVFGRACAAAACHDSETPTGALDLASPDVETRLVGVASTDPLCADRDLVDPTNPDNSFLLEKVESASPQCGALMPLVGTLNPADLECLRSYVHSLAGGTAGSGGAAGSGGTAGSGSGGAAGGGGVAGDAG